MDMVRFLIIAFLLVCVEAVGQPLRDINFEYLYNPGSNVRLELKAVRGTSAYTILYNLTVKDTADLANQYSLEWQARALLSDKEGTPVYLGDLTISRHNSGFSGRGTLALDGAPKFLVAKVTNNTARRAWLFYVALQPNYPVNNYLTRNGFVITEPYVKTGDHLKLALDTDRWIVSYYDDNFPAAAPAFSESQTRVAAEMRVDSVFSVDAGTELNFSRKGLYLMQKDTNAIEGIAIRSEDDYPGYSVITNLPAPLIYITTRQEYEKLTSSPGNKKVFDRTILSIVNDTERARTLMRSYFRRVELANRYFTSYKEGWKTDRGMVYIIYGVPNEVYKSENREIWRYNTSQFQATFAFTRSSSVFDPDNMVLVRERKHENIWYEVIDLWRNARF